MFNVDPNKPFCVPAIEKANLGFNVPSQPVADNKCPHPEYHSPYPCHIVVPKGYVEGKMDEIKQKVEEIEDKKKKPKL